MKKILCLLLALGASPMAMANDDAPDNRNPVQISLYLWGSGLEGRVSPFRHAPEIGTEKSFSDIMDDLEFGGFVNLWMRRDRLVLSADVAYVSVGSAHAFGPLPPLPGPVPPGTVIEGSLDTRQFTASLLVGYRMIEGPDFSFDVLGGMRTWRVSNDVAVSALGLSANHGERFNWVDPLLGVRASKRLSANWTLQGQFDLGGAGVGADSTWSALGTVNWLASDHLSASVGYKVLDVDYRDGGHVFDVRMQGPVVALTYRF